jgi:D-3-phosphoglycerate dehydrogenase
MRNRDIPGVIGRVGTILGEHKINIANFSLGRRADADPGQAGEALAVVHVDGDVPEAVVAELRKAAGVQQAKAIRLF